MNKEQKIADKFGRDAGFKVPEGFLENVYASVSEKRGSLPKYSHAAEKISRWQRIRPYVYLAAMFAGIWCMMKVFTVAQGNNETPAVASNVEHMVSLDNPPVLLAQAVATPEVEAELQIADEINHSADTDMELEQEMQESYDDFSDFEKAFDYDFEDEYATLDVDGIVAQASPEQMAQ